MDALGPIQKLLSTLKSGPGLAALEVADTVSGGHIKEAAKTSSELFSAELDMDTREVALMGLDLARLNGARFRVVLELLEQLIEVQDQLAEQWEQHPVEERPEQRDLLAGAALVANDYARQQSHQRRQIIVDALRGSFCPEPYLWGFQDELLRGLLDSGLTLADLEFLSELPEEADLCLELNEIRSSPEIDRCERLAAGNFVSIMSSGEGRKIIKTRQDAPSNGILDFSVRRTHKGEKLLQMLNAGRGLREP